MRGLCGLLRIDVRAERPGSLGPCGDGLHWAVLVTKIAQEGPLFPSQSLALQPRDGPLRRPRTVPFGFLSPGSL